MTGRGGPSLALRHPVPRVLTGLFLLGIVAAMVAALLQTLSLTITNPVPVDGSHFGFIGSPPVDFADRLSVFTSAGTDLTIVVMLAVASMLTWLQPQGAGRRVSVISVVVLAAIVVLADLVMAVEVGISHGPLFFPGVDATTRATGIVGLLAPASLAVASAMAAAIGTPRAGQENTGENEPTPSTTTAAPE